MSKTYVVTEVRFELTRCRSQSAMPLPLGYSALVER